MVGHAVARIVIRTEEAVMRIRMVKLGFEHVKDSTDAAYKRIIEMAGGSCVAIQQPRQLNGVAQESTSYLRSHNHGPNESV